MTAPTPNTPYQDTRDCRCYRIKTTRSATVTLVRVKSQTIKVVTWKTLKMYFVRLPERKE